MDDEPSHGDPGAEPATATSQTGPSSWTAGRVIGLAASSIAALVGLCLLLGGLALIAVHGFARDDDGYYTADRERLESNSYAIVTDDIDLGADPGGVAPDDLLGTLRVRAESPGLAPVFLGIARTADVDRYMRGVRHAELTDFAHGDPQYDDHAGGAPRGRPDAQDFWVAKSEGAGDQTVNWDVDAGNWSFVAMNPDGSSGVSVDADAGVKIGWLLWVGIAFAIVGLLLTATGVILVLRIGRRAAQP